MKNEYIEVYRANGHLAGEMIRLMLEALGIPALMTQESAGLTYGLTVGPLGEAAILVPSDRAEEAKDALRAMEDGEFTTSADLEEPPSP